MTLRDLTQRQINALQRQCRKAFKTKQLARIELTKEQAFEIGFSEGLKAGLDTISAAGPHTNPPEKQNH